MKSLFFCGAGGHTGVRQTMATAGKCGLINNGDKLKEIIESQLARLTLSSALKIVLHLLSLRAP